MQTLGKSPIHSEDQRLPLLGPLMNRDNSIKISHACGTAQILFHLFCSYYLTHLCFEGLKPLLNESLLQISQAFSLDS